MGHTVGIMTRDLQSMTPLLWVILFAFVLMRTADAHLHLCFDGQESRSSVRVFDHAPVSDTNDRSRRDQDLDALGAVAVKKIAQAELLGPPRASKVVLFLMPPQHSTESEGSVQNPAPKLADLFLPLLRGPPA